MDRKIPLLWALFGGMACGPDGSAAADTEASDGTQSSTRSDTETDGGEGDASGTTGGFLPFPSGEFEGDAFRLTSLAIRDPHILIGIPFLGCRDLVDQGIGDQPPLNEGLAQQITEDADQDGFLDTSLVLKFPGGFDPQSTTNTIELTASRCLAPENDTVCAPDPEAERVMTTYQAMATENCFTPNPDELNSGYSPAITPTTPPCFATEPFLFEVVAGPVAIPLMDVTVTAKPMGTPPQQMVEGILRGFLSESDAQGVDIELPAPFSSIPLAELLPGSPGNCSGADDRDTRDMVRGWWMHMAFEAQRVPFRQ